MHQMIEQEMKARTWTPERLSVELELAGRRVHSQTIRAWLRGQTMPGYENGVAIAKVFGWSQDQMFDAAGYSDGGRGGR
jgi:hypothetical protein